MSKAGCRRFDFMGMFDSIVASVEAGAATSSSSSTDAASSNWAAIPILVADAFNPSRKSTNDDEMGWQQAGPKDFQATQFTTAVHRV